MVCLWGAGCVGCWGEERGECRRTGCALSAKCRGRVMCAWSETGWVMGGSLGGVRHVRPGGAESARELVDTGRNGRVRHSTQRQLDHLRLLDDSLNLFYITWGLIHSPNDAQAQFPPEAVPNLQPAPSTHCAPTVDCRCRESVEMQQRQSA